MQLVQQVTTELSLISIIVLHNLSMALRFCDHFLLFKEGHLCAQGGKDILTDAIIREVFSMEAYVGELNGIPTVLPVMSLCSKSLQKYRLLSSEKALKI